MGKAESFTASWMMHRGALLDLLDAIGDKDANYKPWDNALSLGTLAVHIATAADMFIQSVKAGQFTPPSAAPEIKNMADVRKIVAEYTEKSKADLLAMSDEECDKIVEFTKPFAFKGPAMVMLQSMRDHEIHHKGQLFVYARMVGAENIPFFIKRG